MASRGLLLGLFVLVMVVASAESWSGNYCRRLVCSYTYRRVCRYRLWFFGCCAWRTIRVPNYYYVYFCCGGYRHNGNQNCNIPICRPSCKNGGTCVSPGVCRCPSTHIGYRCDNAVCSYNAPCFPGTCLSGETCDCTSGFASPDSNKQNHCLKLEDSRYVDLNLTEMQVRLSYIKRGMNPPMELHWIMADSSEGQMDSYWTNRKGFNTLETSAVSQYQPPDMPDRPRYVSDAKFGIVSGAMEVWLQKLPPAGSSTPFVSLNVSYPCDISVTSLKPENDTYNCSFTNVNFDRFLEHGDRLKFKFVSGGGGYRTLFNLDTNRVHQVQEFQPVQRDLSVEFRFDFQAPIHCGEPGGASCSSGETMLTVPDLTTSNTISITWNGWRDDTSQMFRYAWEVFPMRGLVITATGEENLEIDPAKVLSPIVNTEVMHDNYAPQSFVLPGPGMYSVILEVADWANNTKYVRRLVLCDPDPTVTSDPAHDLYVSTASPAANYRYQNDLTGPIVVTWDRHFRNALHEERHLLAKVRAYPPQVEDPASLPNSGSKTYLKTIDYQAPYDDFEGQRTVNPITNKRAIVKFSVYHTEDADGGRNQTQEPPAGVPWTDVGLDTSYTVPMPSRTETVTIWVKAEDVLGGTMVNRTQVSFDDSPPKEVSGIQFHMNQPVADIDFASKFTVKTMDEESGIAFIVWKFTRTSKSEVIFTEKVLGQRVESCRDFGQCDCLADGNCFTFTQTFAVSNCHMMVEKAALASEVINVTADVTNMAGLVTRLYMLKDDLTQLNGTEAYYPPQNITITDITSGSVTLTWEFPPSCFARVSLWVVVNGEKRAVHKDAREFAVTGLSDETKYTIQMLTDYEGGEQSNAASVEVVTLPGDAIGIGAIIGIILGVLVLLLLLVLILLFVLWRRGKIFQKEGTTANRQMHRVSRAFDNARKTVRGLRPGRDHESGAFQNNAYKAGGGDDDEIYLYGAMAFNSRQKWQLDDSSLTLMEQVAEGRFATIYKASWRNEGKQTTVAAKMLKAGFSEDDAMKMMAKINFMATQLDDHQNVVRFLGAVTDNSGWGPVLVMEYCEMGQMDKWLAQNKARMSEQVMENLFQFSVGIAKGMEYIASKKITHKRLAARNILLTFLLEPKVAGFGPQHKEGEEERATRVPAKWAAPEVLQEKPATEKSDVWSYGVVLWEIFSMGQVPYPGIHAAEIGNHLKSGNRMEKPEFADDTFYEVMQDCWQYKQSKRPTFSSLRARLAKQYSTGVRQSVDFYYDTKELH